MYVYHTKPFANTSPKYYISSASPFVYEYESDYPYIFQPMAKKKIKKAMFTASDIHIPEGEAWEFDMTKKTTLFNDIEYFTHKTVKKIKK